MPIEKYLLQATVSYKTFNGNASSIFPVQLTLMWRMPDLFGLKGLEFRGPAKGWGENTKYLYGEEKPNNGMIGQMIITANPQIWYAFGRFINFDGLQYLLVSSVQVATGGHWFEVATSPPATYLSF